MTDDNVPKAAQRRGAEDDLVAIGASQSRGAHRRRGVARRRAAGRHLEERELIGVGLASIRSTHGSNLTPATIRIERPDSWLGESFTDSQARRCDRR